MRRALPATGLALFLAAFATPAFGLRTPEALAGRPTIERFATTSSATPADGNVRGSMIWDKPPRVMRAAYDAFLADVGAGWRAAFDSRTGVPRRLYGPGLAAPNSVASAAAAEAASRTFLDRHIALLAPGAKSSDFLLVSNDLDGGMRTVGFVQRAAGMRVLGGQVSFRFKNDRLFVVGSEAIPRVSVVAPPKLVDASLAEAKAMAWIEADFFTGPNASFGQPAVTDIGQPLVLPVAGARGRIEHAVVLPVTVSAPTLRFTVWVDAATGTPVAREQTLRFANATVTGHVPVRSPSYGPRFDAPLPFTKINVEGAAAETSDLGVVTWSGVSPTPVEVFLDGDRAEVFDAVGPEAVLLVDLTDTESFSWDGSADPALDAQLNAFVHAGAVREYARTFAPGLGFLNAQVRATVNIADVCNAYSDGTTINFYASGSGCENTGRLADVVYHEYGHSLHAHAIIEGVGAFEGALSEGVSDYLSATITGDPAMGRGFFMTEEELRHLDPPQNNTWPEDLVGEVHHDGLIIGQALWDMRKELVAKLGETTGVSHSNFLYYEGIRRSVDIPSMHVEVLAADDDDGDITNGTPNVCEINRAFGQHGLVLVSAASTSLGVSPPKQEGFAVSVELQGLFPQCSEDQFDQAVLTWQNREKPAQQGTIMMNSSGNLLTATIPNQEAGTVVRYGVSIAFTQGGTLNLPDNPADPWYEFFVGDVVPLYCTDFETNPEDQGWTHGLSQGEPDEGADDWHWDEPKGNASNGDPPAAFSGDKAFGNDLQPENNYNGLYKPEIQNWAKTPVVATQGHKNIRLQYRRWLTVEDAFFDTAAILANDQPLWTNLDSGAGDDSKTHHTDREWRFQDVDLSDAVSADGNVQVTFQLTSDQGLQLGGWTIDDVCIVAYAASGTVDPCANGACGGGDVGGGDATGGGGPGADIIEPEDGCDCRSTASARGDGWVLALGALAAAGLRRRRRR
jgi:MYXO-CTERM domain-containing protein